MSYRPSGDVPEVPVTAERLFAVVCDTESTWDERIEASAHLSLALRLFEIQLVRHAREQGSTWADIGQALDITRQAAHARFG